jgi:hypothetical protein
VQDALEEIEVFPMDLQKIPSVLNANPVFIFQKEKGRGEP